jgi:hypothetical protein
MVPKLAYIFSIWGIHACGAHYKLWGPIFLLPDLSMRIIATKGAARGRVRG